MCLHIELTDGRGNVKLRLQLIDAEEEREPLFVGEGILKLEDPRAIAEIDFVIQNVSFPAPGEYRFQIFGNNELIIERRLVIRKDKGKE